MSRQHARVNKAKGFTLLELIVVIVILGILAAIAIPTFERTIGRSKESTAQTTLLSIDRDAHALAAMDDEPVNFEHYEIAVSEVTAAAPGLSAAAALVAVQVFDGDDVEAGAGPGEVAVHLTSTTSTIAMLTDQGKPVFVTGDLEAKTQAVASVGSDTVAKADPRVAGGGSVAPPTTTAPPSVAFVVADDFIRIQAAPHDNAFYTGGSFTGSPQLTQGQPYRGSASFTTARLYVMFNDSAYQDPSSYQWGSFQVVSQPAHGSVQLVEDGSGSAYYTHAAGFSGTDSFSYRWCHASSGACKTATVSLRVE